MFAPLAKLLGVYCIKEELEEVSLQYSQPAVYQHLKKWQARQAMAEAAAIDDARQDLEVRSTFCCFSVWLACARCGTAWLLPFLAAAPMQLPDLHCIIDAPRNTALPCFPAGQAAVRSLPHGPRRVAAAARAAALGVRHLRQDAGGGRAGRGICVRGRHGQGQAAPAQHLAAKDQRRAGGRHAAGGRNRCAEAMAELVWCLPLPAALELLGMLLPKISAAHGGVALQAGAVAALAAALS